MTQETAAPPRAHRSGLLPVVISRAWWALRFAAALYLFMGALQIMRAGAAGLAGLQEDGLLISNWASTLGFGWLGALLVLSGSPIAASALTLVKGGPINEIEGFTMMTGSRLGAAFVALLVAVIYALRGTGARRKPLSTAVMALTTTFVIYVPGSLIGYALLRWEPFHRLSPSFPVQFNDLLSVLYGGLLERLEDLPALLLFVGGLLVLLASFKLIDTVLPKVTDESLSGPRLELLKRKWPMFAIGCAVALVTMSVSVALTILIPLVVKGYVKREAIVPYIMGANITTLGDTLLAAFLLDSPESVRIVLAGIVGTTIVSVILLTFFYVPTRRGIWRFQRRVVSNRKTLLTFTAGLFLVPLAIMFAARL
jgi:sodium-dependent phosphate cotransporter